MRLATTFFFFHYKMDFHFPTFTLLFSFLVFMLLVLKILKRPESNNLTPNLPPGPGKLPIIGNMHQLLGALPHQRLRDLAEKYGPVMQIQLGEVHNIIISSAESAKEVMKTHDSIFATRPFLLVAETVFYGRTDIATAPYGEYWRQVRKIFVSELLSAKRVQLFRSIREEEVSNLVRCISSRAGSLINLSRMLFSLTYNITTRAAFGKIRKEEEAFVLVVEGIIETSAGLNIADLFPSIKWLPRISGLKSKLEKMHQEADQILENIISEHKDKKAVAKTGNEGRTDDFVDVLLKLQDDANLEFQLTTDNIKAVILVTEVFLVSNIQISAAIFSIGFLVIYVLLTILSRDAFAGGTETSSTVLEWAMSEMMKNPTVMEKAKAEVRQVFGRKGNVDEAGLGELNYLKLVIKETLRLHPPGPLLLPRECQEQCEIGGYQIPIKSKIIVNAWALARDPNYWAEAERFIPERFLDSRVDYKGANFEFVPFGAGRRMCPGILYGLANVELPLANLLYYFDWKLPGGMRPESLDMTENFGAAATRKNALDLVPIQCHPLPVA